VEWFEDGVPITLPEDYYSSRSLIDKMIEYVDAGDPNRPFFGYVALQAAHAWGPSSLLLRVAHAYEADEDAGGRSAPVDVALGALFGAAVTVSACIETTLTASQPLDDAKNWTYNVTGAGAVTLPERPPPPRGDGIIVTLQPLDIRTFLCDAAFHGGQPIALAQV
jgi:hypothetical protein